MTQRPTLASTSPRGPRRSPLEPLDRRQLLAAVGLDPGFGDFGVTSAPFNGAIVMSRELSSGKILTVGSHLSGGTRKIAIARYDSGGVLDTGFGTNGRVIVSSTVTSVVDAAVQADEKVVIVGIRNNGLYVARLTTTGALDTSFGGDGFADLSVGTAKPTGVAVTSGDKVVVVGTNFTNQFTSAGSLDTSFSGDGKIASGAADVAVQEDDKVVVVKGSSIIRYTTAGAFDTAFAGDGSFTPEYGPSTLVLNRVIVQSTGEIVVAGTADPNGFVGRVKSTGYYYNGYGEYWLSESTTTEVKDVLVDELGKTTTCSPTGILKRFRANGEADSTFGIGGVLDVFGPAGNFAGPIVATGEGNILVAGLVPRGTESVPSLARFSTRPDAALGQNGTLIVTGTDSDDTINIELIGSTVRVNRNGATTDFAVGEVTAIDVSGLAGNDILVNSVVLRTKIVGGDGNDRLIDGLANATMSGNAGKDTVDGGSGNDRLAGNGSADQVNGEGGDDRMYGGPGDDQMLGGGGVDRLFGEDGNDNLLGGSSADKLYGGAGNDSLIGNDQNDLLDGGAGLDAFSGGAGDDLIYSRDFTSAIESIDGGKGFDTVQSDASDVMTSIETVSP